MLWQYVYFSWSLVFYPILWSFGCCSDIFFFSWFHCLSASLFWIPMLCLHAFSLLYSSVSVFLFRMINNVPCFFPVLLERFVSDVSHSCFLFWVCDYLPRPPCLYLLVSLAPLDPLSCCLITLPVPDNPSVRIPAYVVPCCSFAPACCPDFFMVLASFLAPVLNNRLKLELGLLSVLEFNNTEIRDSLERKLESVTDVL